MHNWHPRSQRHIIEQVASWKVVGAINHHVIPSHELGGVGCHHSFGNYYHLNISIDRLQGSPGRICLGSPDSVLRMEKLAMQVAELHLIAIDDGECAHSGRRQVQSGR
jgi:hypothetical protein